MFEVNGIKYDCPYCHHEGPDACCRGVQIDPPPKPSISLKIKEVEGVKFLVDYSAEIKPGDSYIAERNTGPKLLTCGYIHPKHWVSPVEQYAYCFDTWECAKVLKIVEE